MDRASLGRYESRSLVDARLAASEYLDAAQRGINLKARREDEIREAERKRAEEERRKAEAAKTFGWLSDKYLSDPEVQKFRSYNRIRRILEREVLEFRDQPGKGWKDRYVGSITQADVRELNQRILERTQVQTGKRRSGKGIMANRVFSVYRRVFRYGIEKGHISTSPCIGMKRPLAKEESRDHVISLGQIRTLWATLDKEAEIDRRNPKKLLLQKKGLIAVFKLMLLTAQRGAEVRSMAWADLDLENSLWNIPGSKTKNGKSNVIPLSSQALALIRELEPNREISPWVFPSTVDPSQHVDHVQKALQRFRSASEVDHRGHDYRRSAASHMASIGVPPHIIKVILNHSNEKDVTGIYNRYSYLNETRQALQRWGDYLMEVIEKPISAPKAEKRPGLKVAENPVRSQLAEVVS